MNKQSRFFLFIYRTENKELVDDEDRDGDAADDDDAFATGISESPEITYILLKKAEEDRYLQADVLPS